jgi:hypothetical protein
MGSPGFSVMTKLVEKDSIHTVEEDNIKPPPLYQEGGPPQVLTSDTARQAPRGTRVLWVLVALAVGIAWVVIAEFVY